MTVEQRNARKSEIYYRLLELEDARKTIEAEETMLRAEFKGMLAGEMMEGSDGGSDRNRGGR